MISERYEIEKGYKIWDNQHGERVEIGPDGDGLNLVEIRYVNGEGTIIQRITMPYEMADKVHRAFGFYLKDME